jgi:phosphoserine phosphatase RsbU/P
VAVSVVRRIRLPADRRTPGTARAVVRAALTETRLTDLLDEALLLTTEVTTNGVLHARTEIDLEVAVADDAVVITVTDFGDRDQATALPNLVVNTPDEMSERGRGLLLVDRFATSWGVVHHETGKGVWFRLARKPAGEQPEEAQPDQAEPLAAPPALSSLAALAEGAQTGRWSPRAVGETLNRLCLAVGAGGARILLDRADGRGEVPVVEHGRHRAEPALRLSLPVTRPWHGELTLHGHPGPYAAPLARLIADQLGLQLENDRLRRAEQRRQAHLTFLAEASDLLAQSLDVQLTMALIPRLLVPRLGQWCAVWSTDQWGEPILANAAHAEETALAGLTRALHGIGPQVSTAAKGHSSAIALPAPLDGFVLPLAAHGARLGALAVGRPPDRRHDAEDMAVLQDICRRAALALENARIHADRQAIARNLQQELLPPALPSVPGIGLGAEYVPTAGNAEMGGDFYDVVNRPGGDWLVVVGDVSGKGVPAAIVTGVVRDVVRVLARDGRPLTEILTRINETLVERGDGRFCTLVLAGVTRPEPDRLDVQLYLAGHDRPVLVTADGKASQVGTPGTALGLLPTVKTPAHRVTLSPGDTLVLTTDGVTERRRAGELFGIERLMGVCAELSGYAAEAFAARVRAATLAFSTEPPRDDIAILTLRNEAST